MNRLMRDDRSREATAQQYGGPVRVTDCRDKRVPWMAAKIAPSALSGAERSRAAPLLPKGGPELGEIGIRQRHVPGNLAG